MKSVPRNTQFWICIEVVFIFVLVEVLPRDGPKLSHSHRIETPADSTRSGTPTPVRNGEVGRLSRVRCARRVS